MHPLNLIFINGSLKGGTTKPLDIWATDEYNNEGRYVVKCFKNGDVDNFSAAKEIIACEVALKLDIPTPNYDIINLCDDDLRTYYSADEFDKIAKGYKFCSSFKDQCVIFNPLVSYSFLKQFHIENIFAFDFMMLNSDRGGFRNKPNLLINDEELIMIDHELTLPFINSHGGTTDYEKNITNYPYVNHTLLSYLRNSREKSNIFDEFLEVLSKANFESLNPIFDKMDKYGITYGIRTDYLNYFKWCKANTEIIRRYLLAAI